MSSENAKLENLVELMALAIEQHSPMPVMPKHLTLEQAYELQHCLTRRVGCGHAIGIKAGVTTRSVQQQLGLPNAIIGSLYNNARLDSGCRFSSIPGLLLECEIGVTVGTNGAPISIVPVIEIVFLDYTQSADITGGNVIAANLGADRIICGTPQPWNSRFDDTAISLFRDKNRVCTGSIMDSLGGPQQGAKWMLEEACKHRFTVEKGTLFILGTCGPSVPATSGKYLADYGALGCINFTVT